MGLESFLNNGEPQACAFFVLSAGVVGFIEALPDFIQGISWNPYSVIFYRNVDPVAAIGCLYNDGGLRLAEFNGVVDQIIENLLDLTFIYFMALSIRL